MHHSPLVLIHIGGGIVGILSGAVAMTFRKGSRGHRTSGNVFVIAMLIMAGLGALLAVMKNQPTNVCAGVLTCYMVSTAWFTASRTDGQPRLFDWTAFLAIVTVGIVIITLGIRVVTGAAPKIASAPTPAYFIMGSVALLCAAGDLRLFLRRTLSATQRLTRHLWRMSFAFFIASASFFLGQQQVLPASLRGSNVLLFPALAPLGLLLFWLVRVRSKNSYKGKSSIATHPVMSLARR